MARAVGLAACAAAEAARKIGQAGARGRLNAQALAGFKPPVRRKLRSMGLLVEPKG